MDFLFLFICPDSLFLQLHITNRNAVVYVDYVSTRTNRMVQYEATVGVLVDLQGTNDTVSMYLGRNLHENGRIVNIRGI